MRRTVERHIEDPLAAHLIRGDVRGGQLVKVTHKKDEKFLTFKAEDIDDGDKDPVEPVTTVEG